RTGEIHDGASWRALRLGQGEVLREVRTHRKDLDGRKVALQLRRAVQQVLARDLHRDVGDRLVEVPQQDANLHRRAAAELHQRNAFAEHRGNVTDVVFHDGKLGARGVVL